MLVCSHGSKTSKSQSKTKAELMSDRYLTYKVNQNPLVIFLLTELWLLAGQAINLSHEHVI